MGKKIRQTVWDFSEPPKNATRRELDRTGRIRRAELYAYERLPLLADGILEGKRGILITHPVLDTWLSSLEQERPAYSLSAMRRFLLRGFKAGIRTLGWQIQLPPRLITFDQDTNRWKPDLVLHASRLTPIQEGLLQSFLDKDLMRPLADTEMVGLARRRAGQLLVSAMIYGGLLDANSLEALANALPHRFCLYRSWVWVDLHAPPNAAQKVTDRAGPLLRRWFPDSLCEALILRWFTDGYSAIPTAPGTRQVTKNEVWRLVKSFVGEWAPQVQLTSLQDLLETAIAFAQLRIEPHLIEFARGVSGSRSLETTALWRWLSGQPLLPGTRTAGALVQTTLSARSPRRKKSHTPDGQLTEPAVGLATLRRVLYTRRRMTKAFASGKTVRPAEFWKLFAETNWQLTNYLDQNYDRHAPIIQALGGWLETMMKQGTKHRNVPAVSTVYTYLTRFSSRMVHQVGRENIFGFDSREFEALYADILQESPHRSYDKVAEALISFHHFMVVNHGVPDMDWNELLDSDLSDFQADANMVMPVEYRVAKTLLEQDRPQDKRLHDMRLAALILAYRFGLRVSELMLLRVVDLAPKHRILVRPSTYGKLKNTASIRLVPTAGRLAEEEMKLLEALIQSRLQEAGGQRDPDALLFAERDRPRVPLPDALIIPRVQQALRQATGDNTVVLRHLRHSFASLQLLRSSEDCLGDGDSELLDMERPQNALHGEAGWRESHLGTKGESRRCLWQIAANLGHSQPGTTLRHYLHTSDLLLSRRLTSAGPELTGRQMEGLTGITGDAIRKAASRWQIALPLKPTLFLAQCRKRAHKVLGDMEPTLLDHSNRRTIPLAPESTTTEIIDERIHDLNTVCRLIWLVSGGEPLYSVAARLDVPIDLASAWMEANRLLKSLTTPRGAPRYPELFRTKNSLSENEQNAIRNIMSNLQNEDPMLLAGLRLHAERRLRDVNYIDLNTEHELNCYLHLLRETGITDESIEILYGGKVNDSNLKSDISAQTETGTTASASLPAAGSIRIRVRDHRGSTYTIRHHWIYYHLLVDLLARQHIKLYSQDSF